MPKAVMVRNEQNKGKIMIYGDIGDTWWSEYGSLEFTRDIAALGDVTEIEVYINSDGGEVAAATAIYNQLRAHKAKVTTYVDGIAASAASLIFMAGDDRIMRATSILMIHNPGISVSGNSQELRYVADYLDKLKEAVLTAYNRSDISEKEISELMDKETWMTANDALEKGFATKVDTFGDDIELEINGEVLMSSGTSIDLSKHTEFNNFYLKNTKMFKKREENGNMPMMTIEEIKTKNPKMYAEILEIGAKEERERIREIEEMAIEGSEALMKKFKFEEPKSASMFSSEVLKMMKSGDIKLGAKVEETTAVENGKPEMSALEKAKLDAKNSGMGEITPGTEKPEATGKEKAAMKAKMIADKINKKRGFKND